MTSGQYTWSGRVSVLAAAGVFLAAVACSEPITGPRSTAATFAEGPKIVLEDASVDPHDHVVATFSVTQDQVPLALAEVTALDPRFTLAVLSPHPVDGLRAWKSLLLTGSQAAKALPPSGPGTPEALVLQNVKQPGSETPRALVDLGGGRYRYVFKGFLGSTDPDETLRVGVWLRGATPTLRTSSTYDFRPSGGPIDERELVTDAGCGACHGTLVAHGTRTGVRLCLTCHTWQNADPDTVDPAALSTAAAATDPNPLELGRLVHRIHRGKLLPTLYLASSSANPAPALGAGNDLPLPFSPENSITAIVGKEYLIVGYQQAQLVPGRILQRVDNGQPARTVASGITFPRDLRDCGVCHGGAAQASEVLTSVSRRTCAGCHPDTWFQQDPPTLDGSHFAHPGGVQPDDSACGGCHVQATAGGKLYAPIAALHVPIEPGDGTPRYDPLTIEIVRVENLRPGQQPRVTFRVSDRNGPLAPSLKTPSPAWEPDSATSSFVPRALYSLGIRIAGPTSPDYGATGTFLVSGAAGNPDPLTLTTAANGDQYVYTFTSVLPATASGTWAVGMDARRRAKYGHYDKASDTFRWPGTGETVTESPDNPIAYVNTATGVWDAAATPPSPGAVARREVVAEQNCLRCHGRFELHGKQRHQVAYCLFCHNAAATDWASTTNRKKVNGYVDLSQTYDDIEERSIHFKVMVKRIHTGGRTGASTLEAILPYLIGNFYFDEGIFPSDLRNCTLCHVGQTFRPEDVPASALPTIANESARIMHAANTSAHSPGEPAMPPIQAACVACHESGATLAHAAAKTVSGVETCAQCHGASGSQAVEVVHGLVPPSGGGAQASFSSILVQVLGPRCAGCHGAGAEPPRLDAAGAYAALVGVPAGQQPSMNLVEPGSPDRSYLVHKLRGDASSVGGTVGTIMPTDGALPASDLAAIEAWITNGAPND